MPEDAYKRPLKAGAVNQHSMSWKALVCDQMTWECPGSVEAMSGTGSSKNAHCRVFPGWTGKLAALRNPNVV